MVSETISKPIRNIDTFWYHLRYDPSSSRLFYFWVHNFAIRVKGEDWPAIMHPSTANLSNKKTYSLVTFMVTECWSPQESREEMLFYLFRNLSLRYVLSSLQYPPPSAGSQERVKPRSLWYLCSQFTLVHALAKANMCRGVALMSSIHTKTWSKCRNGCSPYCLL